MNLNEYQYLARKTALYPNVGENPIYPTLGLTGEAGEVADKVKKESIKLELGDVLWYVSQLSSELGFDLEEVANANLEKLSSRSLRGCISGDGDSR